MELNTVVCGSLINSKSATFGNMLPTQNFPATSYSLQINQQIYAPKGIDVNIGSVTFGCSPSHSINKKSTNQYSVDGYTINLKEGSSGATIVENCTLAATCQDITNSVQALSQELAALPFDSVHNTAITSQKSIKFAVNAVDCNGVAVFNLSASAVFDQSIVNIQIDNNTAGINLVVINLSGATVTLASSVNMGGAWLSSDYGRARTIWNLYQAVTLELDNSVQGCLLAPEAAVSSTRNAIHGVTVVKSLSTQDGVQPPYIVFPPNLTVCE